MSIRIQSTQTKPNQPKWGVSQMLAALEIDAPEKKEKPCFLSTDSTEIIRTDTFTVTQTKAKSTKEKLLRARMKNQWRNAAVRTHMRLARASSQQECRLVAHGANMQISQLKRAMHNNSENKTEARVVLSQMQKAVIRAHRKVRQLDREDDLQQLSKKAENDRKRAKAEYFELQQKKKIIARKGMENGYIHESMLARYHAAEQMRQQMDSPIPSAGVQASAPTAPTVASSAPQVSIPVSQEMV